MHEEDRRRSFRCPVSPDDEPAILRTNKGDVIVSVHEKSAGGFGVTTEQNVAFREGQVLSLATNSGCTEVEVMHIEAEQDRTRVGLKVIRELKYLGGGPLLSIDNLRRCLSSGSNVLRLAAMILLCGGFFIWGATLPVGQWAKGAGDRIFGDSSNKNAAYTVNPQLREKQLALNFLRLDGLTNHKFAISLDLSPQQSTQIRGIVDDTTAALSLLYDRKGASADPDQWSDLGMQTIHASWRQIEKVLSEQQRAKWDAMLDEAAANNAVGMNAK
ncbi:MAG: PilZ domain-containing protein [Pirellulaceae bacterium]